MSINISNNNNLAYGFNNPLVQLPNPNIRVQRRPTSSDTATVGTLWLYSTPGQLPELYMYTSPGVWTQLALDDGSSVFDSLTVNGPTILNGDLTIPVFTTTGVLVTDADGVITDADASTAGFVLTSNGPSSTPTFQPASGGGGGMTWYNVTSTTQALAIGNGYIANNAGVVTMTLPATAAIGSVIGIAGAGAGGWRIAQNAGQTIFYGDLSTTTGVSGSLSSSLRRDNASLICTATNTDLTVLYGNIGNLTVI